MIKNFPNLIKSIDTQIQEISQTQAKRYRKIISTHIKIKLLKASNEEKVFFSPSFITIKCALKKKKIDLFTGGRG